MDINFLIFCSIACFSLKGKFSALFACLSGFLVGTIKISLNLSENLKQWQRSFLLFPDGGNNESFCRIDSKKKKNNCCLNV